MLISMQSIQNLGLALIAMAVGAILDAKGYLILQVFFCICVCSKCVMFVFVSNISVFIYLFFYYTQNSCQEQLYKWFPLFFSPSPPVALMAVVALYFVDFLKGKVEMAFWTLPPLHFSCSQIFFFPPFPMWLLFTRHSSAHPTHSLLNLSRFPPSRCRRRFEPVSRRQSQTPERSRFTGRVSSFDPSSASITAFRHTSHAVRRASKKHN